MEQRRWTFKWYLKVLKKKLWLIMLVAVICAITGGTIGYYNQAKVKPEYEVSAILLIEEPGISNGDKAELDYDEYRAINKSIINHFSGLLKMELIIDEIIDKFQLDMTYKEFITKMDVKLIDNSNMLELRIRDKDLDLAKNIVDELTAVSLQKSDEILGIGNIQLIDQTETELTISRSMLKQKAIVLGVLGALLAILIIFSREYMDTTITNAEDIEHDLELSVIGTIRDSSQESKLIMYEQPDSFAAETYRKAIININSMQREKKSKTILLTSPTPNNHKSKVAANIAVGLSKTGKKVLLLDGDLRKPSISSLFAVDNKIGLSDVIYGNVSLNDTIIKSKIEENLDILLSGKTSLNPADLLALEDMKTLLKSAEKQYDLILIDAPSLEVVADTFILSTAVDLTILMCEVRNEKIEDAQLAKQKLSRVDSDVVAILFKN